MASAATTMVGGTAQLGATAGGATSQAEGLTFGPNGYFVDTLFRSDHPSPDRNDVAVHAEVERIFANALRQGDVPAADKTYLGQLVAARMGLSQSDAEKRVSAVMVEARQAADTARKAAAHLLLWIFLALLIGAFCASYAATIGASIGTDLEQFENAKLILIWGSNPIVSNLHLWSRVQEAKRRGARIQSLETGKWSDVHLRGASYMTIAPDGKTFVYSDWRTGDLFIRPLENDSTRTRIPARGFGASFSPDGKWVYFIDRPGISHLMRVALGAGRLYLARHRK